ncbi:MAG: hypothetical protein IK120_08020 [Muribaculaceae bacterium]|nr:hypothetical protein [Muribaculaceae bacterium]MBR5764175.1 hypothetical protein [Bacteroidaceae bacterium]
MKQIIIYGSRYGSAKRYAEKLAEQTGIEAVAHSNAKNIGSFDRVIYLGAIYAGSILGLKSSAKKMTEKQELIVVSVGLTDTADPSNIGNIRSTIKSQIPAHLYNESRIFHLRGAIDHNQLGFFYRLLMRMIHSKASKTPAEELDATAKAVLETYGKRVDYVDFNKLQTILDIIKE